MSLLRESFHPAPGFVGLEEPRISWPLFARADLIVHPVGCTEDSWLPVQVKSTQRRLRIQYGQQWGFNHLRGYPGIAILCISLEVDSPAPPKVWIFSGDSFTTGPGYLSITQKGKHDTEESRCTFGRGDENGRSVGEVLFEKWHAARASNRLDCLDTLRNQQSPAHLAEQAMMEKCQYQIFDHVPGGLEVNSDAPPCPSAPYDIEIRQSGSATRWQEIQLKSAGWNAQKRHARVISYKRRRGVAVPYEEGDFQFLLVGPPQNSTLPNVTPSEQRRLLQMSPTERWRLFYFIPMAALVQEGLVSVEKDGQRGITGFSLDFLPWDPPAEYSRRYSNKRSSLLQWRIDTSDPIAAGKKFLEILKFK
uniref:Uncharacterized protein n=1 Tax=Chromera velia CCMP2878 TaxID=1169474 RepID=A0A0G4FUK7_9ALVE|eukprot:Cvel_18780.t1-p1 / transcript=Cvel_18780.t1 / gene=Cvel_18780 / organism=Chromera_velia_CCMP2878 / gene_product=hypothetical protein / transcript_product=hypothetical protein / location=Cvel_scaffold1576:32118-33203(+) / protein_length=362 / sequence_SO=supercontig / SO=protein_coding / is_pseudo=false